MGAWEGLYPQYPGHMSVYMHPPQMHMPGCAHHPMQVRRPMPPNN